MDAKELAQEAQKEVLKGAELMCLGLVDRVYDQALDLAVEKVKAVTPDLIDGLLEMAQNSLGPILKEELKLQISKISTEV
jgi:hypothetical protein